MLAIARIQLHTTWSNLFNRAIDHETTRVGTRGGRMNYVRADPHITARFGGDDMASDLELYKAHAHVYVMYDGGRNPSRLAHPSELRYLYEGTPNPELWDRRGGMIAFRRS